jgi:hypothetical protein
VVVCTPKVSEKCWILSIFSFEVIEVTKAGPSKHLHTGKLEETDIMEELYCDTDSEEATVHQKIIRRVTMMNWNGNAMFLLIKHVHTSLLGTK